MSSFSTKCCVCLSSPNNMLNLDECYPRDESLIQKLKSVVPEVEWLEGYSICQECTRQLNVAHEFRLLCIQKDESRKQVLATQQILQVFTCYHCEVSFPDKQILIDHIQTHHLPQTKPAPQTDKQQQQYKCDNCTRQYCTQKGLKDHSRKCKNLTSKSARSFSCEMCSAAFSYVKLMVEHCLSEHSMDRKTVKPYTCDECPMRFTSSANLIQHKKYHLGSRTHICSFCGKSYITQSDLTVHEYTHFNRRNYRCESCHKAFNTNKNLRSHILVVHTDSSLWKHCCGVCGKRFPLKSGYDQHMKRHAGDKKFACHICEKTFVSRSELTKHLGYHSTERPFKCTLCDKAYKENKAHAIHLTKVHGIGDAKVPPKVKKFKCEICPSAFSDTCKLKRHGRTHSRLQQVQLDVS